MSEGQPQLVLVTGPPPQNTVHHRGPQVPPRVQVAMEFLRRLDSKTAVVPLPTYSGDRYEVHPVDGQKLCDEEVAAQATACNLLSQYFAGKLTECQWDKPLPADPKIVCCGSQSSARGASVSRWNATCAAVWARWW